MKSEGSSGPVYLQALMPTSLDAADTTASASASGGVGEEVAQTEKEENSKSSKEADFMDTSLPESESMLDCSVESFENPFLKASKRVRT